MSLCLGLGGWLVQHMSAGHKARVAGAPRQSACADISLHHPLLSAAVDCCCWRCLVECMLLLLQVQDTYWFFSKGLPLRALASLCVPCYAMCLLIP